MEKDSENAFLFFSNASYFNEIETLDLELKIFSTVVIFVVVIGLIGNCALIYILHKPTTQSKITDIYILNLAIIDLAVLIFCLLIHDITSVLYKFFPFGRTVCSISHIINKLSMGVSAFTLAAMSIHTFRTKQTPPTPPTPPTPMPTTTPDSRRGKRNVIIAIAVAWGLAFLFSTSTIVFTLVFEYECNTMCDGYIDNLNRGPELHAFFAAPLPMAFTFLIIGRENKSADKEFLKMTAVLVSMYAVCFLPTYIDSYRESIIDDGWYYIYVAAFCLRVLYRCLNPVALYVASGRFRKLYNRNLLCWCVSEEQEPVGERELEIPLRDGAQSVDI